MEPEKIKNIESEIQYQLELELAKSGPTSGIAFGTMATFYFFGLDIPSQINFLVDGLCVFLLVVNLLRVWVGRSSQKLDRLSSQNRRLMFFSVVGNSLAWSIIFIIYVIFYGYESPKILPVLVALFGMGMAAPFTLSRVMPLLNIFIWSWIAPQILLLIYERYAGTIQTSTLLTYGAYYVFTLNYTLRGGTAYASQIRDKARNDLKLLFTTQELSESRQKIIEQTAQTQHANRLSAIGEMAGGIAHEINTPLAAIKMRAEVIMDSLDSEPFDKERLRDEAKKIDVITTRIAKIIQGLRTFSRDCAQDPMETVLVSGLVDSTMGLCQERFKENGIEFSIRHQDELSVQCVPVQMTQVLVNILNNAFDAVQGVNNPLVEVRTLLTPTQMARIEFWDNGPGVPENLTSKLMQPFFTTKEVGRGTGLGLSVSKGILEKHGGNISYLRSDNRTCFSIELPAIRLI